MKKFLSYLLVLIMLIPCLVLADYKYSDGVKKTDTYIFTYSDYARYVKIKDGLPYGFSNGKAEITSGFKSGGFITKPEYDITNSGPSVSWLSPGIEYWLINKWKVDTKPTTGSDDDKSGVRITEYVLSNAKVKGTGTISNPWIFVDGFSIKIGTTDKTIGQISPEDGYEHIGAGEGPKEFILTYDNRFPLDTRQCENAASATGSTFSITNGASDNTKKITISNASKDFTCFISFGINCYDIAFNDVGGSNGIGGQHYYYQYGRGWFGDNTCKTALNPTPHSPNKKGYICKGYMLKDSPSATTGVVIVDTNDKLVPGVKDFNITTGTAYAMCNPITYTINYDCNTGSGNVESSTHIFDSPKSLTANNCTKTGYTFKGWARNATDTTAEFTNQESVTNVAETQGAVINLYAVWKDETKPSCSIERVASTVGTTGGITFNISCSDEGSGCTEASTFTRTGVKSTTTYTVYDNAGNSQTCTGTVTAQRQKRTRSWNSCLSQTWSSCATKPYDSCAYTVDTCKGCYTSTCYGSYYCTSWSSENAHCFCGGLAGNCCGCKRDSRPCNWNSCCSGSRNECRGANVCKGGYVCQGGWNSWSSWSNATSCSSNDSTDCRTIYK